MIPFPLPTFKQLRSLHLYEICGDLRDWIQSISATLQQSPEIQELGLSLSHECDRFYQDDIEEGTSSQSYYTLLNFFTLIIKDFKAGRGAKRLRLRSLKLGFGVLLNNPMTANSRILTTSLSDLTDLAVLKELYIDNDLDVGCGFGRRIDLGRVAWQSITSTSMPQLDCFSFTGISERSRDWLYTVADPNLLARLTLGIGTGVSAYTVIRPDDGNVERVDPQSISQRIASFGESLFFLKPSGNDRRENLPIRSRTLLILGTVSSPKDYDVLKTCTWIETLVVCFNQRHIARRLAHLLLALPTLDNLWIRVGMGYAMPSPASSDMITVRTEADMLLDEQHYLRNLWQSKWRSMADMVASSENCPLKYLKIGHLTWRVLSKAKGKTTAILEPVDRWDEERRECPYVFWRNDPLRRFGR